MGVFLIDVFETEAVTPDATVRLEKPPSGAPSKSIKFAPPRSAAAASKLAAAAIEFGRGSVEFAPASAPENTMSAARAGATQSASSTKVVNVHVKILLGRMSSSRAHGERSTEGQS